MKTFKNILTAVLLSCFLYGHGQTVEKSLFNVQAGTLGAVVSNEARLSDSFVLRTGTGLFILGYDSDLEGVGYTLAPGLQVEPKWYYNIAKRNDKGKNTAKNSANFISFNACYFPDLFVIGNLPDDVVMPNNVFIAPNWGLRRMIGKSNFNYEVNAGIGYRFYLKDNANIRNASGILIDLQACIGYTF